MLARRGTDRWRILSILRLSNGRLSIWLLRWISLLRTGRRRAILSLRRSLRRISLRRTLIIRHVHEANEMEAGFEGQTLRNVN
jgi:hypothetical protein